MCCQRGDFETHRFGGCIEGHKKRQCPEDHPLWIRGVISCGPVAKECLGERCCEFGQAWGSENSTLNWTPPENAGFAPTSSEDEAQDAAEPTRAHGETSSQSDATTSPEPPASPAPDSSATGPEDATKSTTPSDTTED
jgi:hypothetical protein